VLVPWSRALKVVISAAWALVSVPACTTIASGSRDRPLASATWVVIGHDPHRYAGMRACTAGRRNRLEQLGRVAETVERGDHGGLHVSGVADDRDPVVGPVRAEPGSASATRGSSASPPVSSTGP